jgi:hypothetical protein
MDEMKGSGAVVLLIGISLAIFACATSAQPKHHQC